MPKLFSWLLLLIFASFYQRRWVASSLKETDIEFTLSMQISLPGHSLIDTQLVRPWMLDRPIHGADGRLANTPSAPF
ncbi:hypothetical protein ACROAG_16845 [Shewanella oncorhynchi]|uniref:hypothetical protein n=1 Tax=Shewanella oncorhynchi TaxID=2726434 RepID=UPI003D7902E3